MQSVSLHLLIGMPGPTEWIIILVIGLLIFGRRLPELARSLGKSVVEFKKGIRNIEDEVEQAEYQQPAKPLYNDSEESDKSSGPSQPQ